MIYSLVFLILGLFVGSFLSVVVFRYPNFKSIVFGRSECKKCKKGIKGYDLIPVFSYLLLLGRCRNCGEKISLIYPAIELLTGGLFFLFSLQFGISFILFPYLLLVMILVVIFIYDVVHLEIPELFLWLVIAVSAIIALFSGNNLSDILLGGLVGGGFLGLLVGISGEKWMGSGDIFIGLAFGLLVGLKSSVLFLFLAFSLGAIFGLILIAIRGKKIKSEIAFAPFLIIAGIVALLWGGQLINLYLNFVII